jgi:hypothetical protein
MEVADDTLHTVHNLQLVDFDGDGRPDIVAGGRSTHNVKVYMNRGK